MSTIGNSSGHLSIHTQISADIVGSTAQKGAQKSSEKVTRERDQRKSNHVDRNQEDHRSEHAKNQKMRDNQNSDSKTGKTFVAPYSQAGHWKSEYSTIVIFDRGLPLYGILSKLIFERISSFLLEFPSNNEVRLWDIFLL